MSFNFEREYIMSYFRDCTAIGSFRLPEFNTEFEYRLSDGNAPGQGNWGIENGFPFEIAVCDGSVRFAIIKKTVAYVAINEDEYGKPVVEKWKIKHLWKK